MSFSQGEAARLEPPVPFLAWSQGAQELGKLPGQKGPDAKEEVASVSLGVSGSSGIQWSLIVSVLGQALDPKKGEMATFGNAAGIRR